MRVCIEALQFVCINSAAHCELHCDHYYCAYMQVQELEEANSSLNIEKRTLSERIEEKISQTQKVSNYP